MQKIRCLAVVILCSLTLYGCSSFKFPGVYRIDVQQGNIITQEMVDQLQIGMTPRQVQFILGSPLLSDSFNLDRWDYYYSLKDGKGKFSEKRVTVYFKDDRLDRVTGEYSLPANRNSSTAQ